MIEIPLGGRGGVALVDEGDAARVLEHRWHLHETAKALRARLMPYATN